MSGVVPYARSDLSKTPAVRSVTILGATGSIGASTIDLIHRNPNRFRVEAVTASTKALELAEIAISLGAKFAAIADPARYGELKQALSGTGIASGAGEAAVVEAAQRPAEWVMGAITGAAGLRPTLAAADRGATVALANKETLVCAGDLFMRRAAEKGATVLPVDSEHNAIFQSLMAGTRDNLHRIILTASGGPFRSWTKSQIQSATLEQALKHPNWSMGPKVTIDSATLMNKGLEVIEAHHLFNLPAAQIDVFVHPQSIVHGMVEFCDGSMVAHLGPPDMRVPIAHCLSWPERIGAAARLELGKMANLTFEAPDLDRFPALRLARLALETGGGAPTVLNAANEIAVQEFINRRIGFSGIPKLVEATIEAAGQRGLIHTPADVEDALAIDHESRSLAKSLVREFALKANY